LPIPPPCRWRFFVGREGKQGLAFPERENNNFNSNTKSLPKEDKYLFHDMANQK
jgi:hypothetical protein